METYQDEQGQWWVKYPTSPRRRAEERTCEGCGTKFVIGEKSKTRFCGRSCGMRYAGSCRDPKRGEEHPNWRGGRHVRKREGYVEVRVTLPDGSRGYVLEHRHVMADHLGRELYDYETVHHKNGDKGDNRLENLELHVGNHGRGATHAHCPTCTCFS